MDGIRFILEDPQAANSRQKKRSRLVTACDTCRAKKIKCHQSPGAPKCEACRVSKSACRFRDRERYHAQRSGSLSSTYAPSSCSSSEFDYTPSEPNNLVPYGEVDPALNGLGLGVGTGVGMMARRATMPSFGALHQSNRSSSLPPALPRLPGALHMRSGSPNGEIGPHRVRKSSTSVRRNIGPVPSSADFAHPHFRHHPHSAHSTPSLLGLSPLTNFRDLALDESYSRPAYPGAGNSPYARPNALGFDSSRPAHPAPPTMEKALELFQEHFEHEDGGRFLWLHAEALRHTWRERALPAPVANCIAALSLRFSVDPPSPNGSNGGPAPTPKSHLGEPYLEMAKDLIVPLVYTPSVENLHSLVLLSWSEYGTGRENGLNLYSALAVQMARDLGLGSEDTIKTLPTEHEQSDLRQTWWAVVTLDILSSFLTGNPANLSLQGCSTAVPSSYSSSSPLSASISADGTETGVAPETPYLTLYDLLSLRDQMLQTLNFQMSQQQHSPQQSQPNEPSPELQDILSRLHAIQLALPSHLTLSLTNFRRAKRSGPGNQLIYVLLHLVLGALGIVGGAPSVFRCMGGVAGSGLAESVRDSARTILDVIVMLEQVDGPKAITSFPFLDFPLALAARVFALESRAEQEQQQLSTGSPLSSQEGQSMEKASRGRFAEVNSGVCNNFLARLAEHWGNVSNVQMAVQSGTVWTIVCPVQQSPVAIPSALDLHGVQYGMHPELGHFPSGEGSQMQSREASPLLFEFPGMGANPAFHGHRGSISGSSIGSSQGVPPMPGSARSVSSTLSTGSDFEEMRPSSDPTPTTMLPPVSLAGGDSIGLGLNGHLAAHNLNGSSYDDVPISSYMSPSSGNTFPGHHAHAQHHGQDLEYFSVLGGPNSSGTSAGEAGSPGMAGNGCIPVGGGVFGGEAGARVGSFSSSPWLMS